MSPAIFGRRFESVFAPAFAAALAAVDVTSAVVVAANLLCPSYSVDLLLRPIVFVDGVAIVGNSLEMEFSPLKDIRDKADDVVDLC